MEEEVKVAVLETRLENFETLVSRLDSAIEKIAEVNNNVSRMLAVHEQRISKQEEIDEVLFDKIDKLRDKMDSDHDSVTKRLSLLEKKLWIGMGALAAILVITNPQSLKTLRPLISSTESAILSPVVASVNESY
jgi:Rad3-related DNA helicase